MIVPKYTSARWIYYLFLRSFTHLLIRDEEVEEEEVNFISFLLSFILNIIIFYCIFPMRRFGRIVILSNGATEDETIQARNR